jgi:hypothetical protein
MRPLTLELSLTVELLEELSFASICSSLSLHQIGAVNINTGQSRIEKRGSTDRSDEGVNRRTSFNESA